MIFKKILRMGVQKTPLQKAYETLVGTYSLNIEFYGSNREFDWMEISLNYNKSDKHLTICNSYNVEKAETLIKYLGNFTEA